MPNETAPERIWLLDHGSGEATWCEDPPPDYEDHSAIEYVRADMLTTKDASDSAHASHCDQGEYIGGCKYGDADCPTLAVKAASDSADEVERVERVTELALAAFLAGRGSVTSMKHGTRVAKPAPTMAEFRGMALAALSSPNKDNRHA